MKITEPTTMITDYLITIFGVILSILLVIQQDMSLDLGVWALVCVFLSTSLSAFLGGTSHGFKLHLTEDQNSIIWKITLALLGFSSAFFIIAATLSSITGEQVKQVLILVALLQLISYLKWIRENDEFIYAIFNYGLAMIIVIGIKIYSYFVFADPSSFWIILSILTTLIGSSIQAMKISLHDEYFNHNDLFHVIQLLALYFLYLGGMRMIYPV